MRIALDATPVSSHSPPHGGIRRYTIELATALAENPNDEVFLFTDQPLAVPQKLRRLANVTAPEHHWGLSKRWWSLELPRLLVGHRIDVFHGTDFAVPYLPVVPSVLTIHDLSPWKEGDLRPQGSDRVRVRTPRLLVLATKVVTPTEAVRLELLARMGIGPGKVRSVHLGATRLPPPRAVEGLAGPYVAYVGDRGARKNLSVLFEAWRLAREQLPNLALALIGGGPSAVEGPQPGLIEVVNPDNARLADLLGGASALVYPSLYEGFGLPIVEAMSLGTPVIASQDPALVEVAGGCAIHLPANSPAAFAAAIVDVVSDPGLSRRLAEDGKVRASEFSWQRTAQQTRAIYEEAIESF